MKRWLPALLWVCLGVGGANAVVPDELVSRPDKDGPPTKVHIGVYYIDISEIDGAAEEFRATAYFDLYWVDPRLRFAGKKGEVRYYRPDEIWTPSADIINGEGVEDQYTPMCVVYPDGTVYDMRRIVARLSTQMNLRLFPFDRQKMNFVVETSSWYGSSDLVFVPDPGQSGIGTDVIAKDWTYEPLGWNVIEKPFANTGTTYSRAIFSFEAARKPGYFIWKVILPTVIFVFLTWTVFWLPVDDVQTPLLVTITVLLTAVVFGNSTDSLMPRLGYRTLLDEFETGSFLFIAFAAVEAIAMNQIHLSGKGNRAAKCRSIMRVVYPTLYAVFCVVLFSRGMMMR